MLFRKYSGLMNNFFNIILIVLGAMDVINLHIVVALADAVAILSSNIVHFLFVSSDTSTSSLLHGQNAWSYNFVNYRSRKIQKGKYANRQTDKQTYPDRERYKERETRREK